MQDIHPIKDVIDIPFFSWWEWGLILFLLSFIVFRIGQLLWNAAQIKKKKTLPAERPEIPDTYFEDQIQILKELIESNAFKEFCHKATEVLKQALEQKYKTNITDWTTTEILLFARQKQEDYNRLKKFFWILDPVKFAKQKTHREKATEAFEILVFYIQQRND